jgi:AcrR family transcriptional regulator
MEISKNRVNPVITSDAGDHLASGRRYGGVDQQERQRQRRERLVTAALAVFGEQGYHPSTVRDVCKRAELTSRYFYESFASMDALFEAVYMSVSRELMHKTVALLQTTPMVPEKLAEAAIRTFLEFIKEDPRRARVILIDSQNVGPGTSRISQEADRDFVALLTGFIEMLYPGLEDKVGLNAALMSTGLLGAVMRMATVWVENKCDTPLEDMLRNIMMFYVAGIHYAEELLVAHGGTLLIGRTERPTLPERSKSAPQT